MSAARIPCPGRERSQAESLRSDVTPALSMLCVLRSFALTSWKFVTEICLQTPVHSSFNLQRLGAVALPQKLGFSLVELLVVLAIIAVLLGLLLPAVQMVRERARDAVCKNNVYQINLAVVTFLETHKKLPRRGRAGKMGGWMVDILPFIEQQNLQSAISPGTDVALAPESILRPPLIFRCPRSAGLDQIPPDKMSPGHYALVTLNNRAHLAGIYDAPIDLKIDWATGPEMDYHAIPEKTGPHYGGFHFSRGAQQGVGFMLHGKDVW